MDEAEAIRLVIWDLDETFWAGTLSEGGHHYSKLAHDTVVALARRGIVSSICSKNDHATVEAILRAEGIWDYFVFPSIDWTPKGHRLKALVEAVKLRPASVLFIDDNKLNLAEARHACPDIQTASETIVPILLSDARCAGKADPDLTRLSHYRVLQQKHQDARSSAGDNTAFLRNSDIRVYIEHDLDAHLDRAVELINRTNQLNFTKQRLPEDAASARTELRHQVHSFLIDAGLVFARDRYGDYGCIGLYVMSRRGRADRRLLHFCFSCRTLGMNIETWLYNRLGRPSITVAGEVLTDLAADGPGIDWISEVPSLDALGLEDATADRLPKLIVRGGCDVRAVMHYFDKMFEQVHEELFDLRHGMQMRTDHSIFVRYALHGISEAAQAALLPLGFHRADFSSAMTGPDTGPGSVVFASFWQDARTGLYRDTETGIRVPVVLPKFEGNLLAFSDEEIRSGSVNRFVLQAAEHLRSRFVFEGPIAPAEYAETISELISALPSSALLIILQPPTRWTFTETGRKIGYGRQKIFAAETARVARGHDNVHLLSPEDYIEQDSDYGKPLHFTRPVYQRIAQAVIERLGHRKGRLVTRASTSDRLDVATVGAK